MLNYLKKILSSTHKFADESWIEPISRMSLRYYQNNEKNIDIGYTHVPWSKSYELIVDSIDKWNPPFDTEQIVQETRDEIIKKIVLYGKIRKHNVIIK